jgi:hypothetical protein
MYKGISGFPKLHGTVITVCHQQIAVRMMCYTNDIFLVCRHEMFKLARLVTKAINVSVFSNTIDPISFRRDAGTNKISTFSLTR